MTDAKFGDIFWKSARGPHVNITDCEQLEMAIDESCNFDMQQVKDFTEDIKNSDGWSIGFWVKAAGSKSLSNDGKFYPGLSLLHSISPPKPFFGLGKFFDPGAGDGEFVYAGTDGRLPPKSTGGICDEAMCRSPGPGGYDCWANNGSEPMTCAPGYESKVVSNVLLGDQVIENSGEFKYYTCCKPGATCCGVHLAVA